MPPMAETRRGVVKRRVRVEEKSIPKKNTANKLRKARSHKGISFIQIRLKVEKFEFGANLLLIARKRFAVC